MEPDSPDKLNPDATVAPTTDGKAVVSTPVQSDKRGKNLERGLSKMHARFAGAFKRLAE